ILAPTDIFSLIPSLTLLPISFGLYLRRDRDVFDRQLRDMSSDEVLKNFASHEEVLYKEVEVSSLLSTKLKSFFDFAYHNHNQNFIIELVNYALSQRNSSLFIEKRLGLNLGSFKEASIKYILEN